MGHNLRLLIMANISDARHSTERWVLTRGRLTYRHWARIPRPSFYEEGIAPPLSVMARATKSMFKLRD
jgi:hypothetical protein